MTTRWSWVGGAKTSINLQLEIDLSKVTGRLTLKNSANLTSSLQV